MKKICISTIILTLLGISFLSIASANFHKSLYKLMTLVPYDSLLKNSLINEEMTAKSLVQAASNRIVKRAVKNLVTKESSIPILGPTTVLVVTAEIKDGCDHVHDIQEINKALGIEDIENNVVSVCGMKIPRLD